LEKTIYEYDLDRGSQGELLITNKKIKTHDALYTTKSINGVFYEGGLRNKIVHFIFLSIIIFLVSQSSFFSDSGDFDGFMGGAIFGVILWVVVFSDSYLEKYNYFVYINDFGKKKKIYTTTSEEHAKNIVESIEKAISQ